MNADIPFVLLRKQNLSKFSVCIYLYIKCCMFLPYVDCIELWYLREAHKTGMISIFMASVRFFVHGQKINIYVDVLIYSI